jgi:hypothetical protein
VKGAPATFIEVKRRGDSIRKRCEVNNSVL